jgi:hypothetical protein
MPIQRWKRGAVMMSPDFAGPYVKFLDHEEAMDQAAKKILELEQQLKERK